MRRALFLCLLFFGCDSSEPLDYVPTYDPLSREPVSSTEFCSLLARNTCAVLRPCCVNSTFAFDEAKCRTNSRLLCEARRQKSMEIGLLYDDVQAGRCVRGTAILMRECRIVTDDPIADDVVEACREVLHGTRAVGVSCEGRLPVECAPPDLGVRVACLGGLCATVAPAQAGEWCTERPCLAGLQCDASRRCTAKVHPLGSPCEPCFGEGTCTNDLACGPDRFCNSKPAQPVCAVLPTLGERCDSHGCVRPYRCDTDKAGNQVCADGKTLGAPCNDNGECASRLCIGGTVKLCAPPVPGDPIATASLAAPDYLARIAASCQGMIPDGAGGLAPLLQFPATTD